MRLPVIAGIIKRRILVNFRVLPEVIQQELPAGFRPKLHNGHAIAGICLIRLEKIRPSGFPEFIGISSENAAHRVAVQWPNADGTLREGVYIGRRDTGSLLNSLAGGRIFPGEHHRGNFRVTDDGDRVDLQMKSRDGTFEVELRAHAADQLPRSSSFDSLESASAFFEPGAIGYSVTTDRRRLDGLRLQTHSWKVKPLEVEMVHSSYFENHALFPAGSAVFDHALIMRDIVHEWHQEDDFRIRESPSA